jgi:hypothetical protein
MLPITLASIFAVAPSTVLVAALAWMARSGKR